MKKNFLAASVCIAVMLTSCKDKKAEEKATEADVVAETENTIENALAEEEFKIVEAEKVEALNKAIASKNLKSEEEIIAEYYPEEEEIEGDKYNYNVTKLSSEEGKTVMQLLVEGQPDDSVEGIKVIMSIVKDDKGLLTVEEIKESYRCYTGRGSQEWSNVICL